MLRDNLSYGSSSYSEAKKIVALCEKVRDMSRVKADRTAVVIDSIFDELSEDYWPDLGQLRKTGARGFQGNVLSSRDYSLRDGKVGNHV